MGGWRVARIIGRVANCEASGRENRCNLLYRVLTIPPRRGYTLAERSERNSWARRPEKEMDDLAVLRVTSLMSIPRSELEYRASRAGGAGGQHVNTSSTRIELLWDLP